jgi:hypothetical protein
MEEESVMKKVELFPDPYITPFHIFGERFLDKGERRGRRRGSEISSLELREARKTRDVNRKLRLLQALKSTAKKKGSKYHAVYRSIFGFSKSTSTPKQIGMSCSPYASLFQASREDFSSGSTVFREAWERMEIYYFKGGKFRPAPIRDDVKSFAKFFSRTPEQALFDTVSWYLLPSFRREVKNLFKKYRHLISPD